MSLELSDLLTKIRADYPDLSFIESAHFSWHAERKHVSFKKVGANVQHNMWALLHELGHALLAHTGYTHDIELLQMEVAAWEKARELASYYGLKIDEDYLQDCVDTYRDWLHLRATCPACFGRSLQASETTYRCFNCQTQWQVTRSRLCRPYRLQKQNAPLA
jgi:23S rRNA G2069 N7-methylase RlmK/C1962 C5-methylase RlmI